VIFVKKAVLDACVIFPASIRDTLLSIASEGCFIPHWSQMIHNEWQRNLLKSRPDLTQDILNKTSEIMDKCFHGSCFNDFHHVIEQIKLPDANDCHVLALAITVGANFIITNNLKDFPKKELSRYNIMALTPDNFLVSLYEQFDMMVIEGVGKQRARLKNPSKTQDEFINTLRNAGLVKFSNILESVKREI